MAKSAILAIRIIAEAKEAAEGFDEANEHVSGFNKTLGRASAIAAVGLAALAEGAHKLIEAAEPAEVANKKIESITDSMGLMGDESEEASERVIKSAENLAKKTGIDPNLIKQGDAVLSTFSNIESSANKVGGVFDRTQALAADLSKAGFGQVTDTAKTLGIALNDPAQGLTRLRRIGVTFTQAQQDQIKAMQAGGDIAGAQGMILDALEKKVGGVADATATSADKQKVAWQLTQEKLGSALLPLYDTLMEKLGTIADWIGDHTELVEGLALAFAGIASGVLVISGAMKVFAAVQAIQTAAQWANNAAWLASPITWIVLAIVAAIAAVIAITVLLITHWSDVQRVAGQVWSSVIGWAHKVAQPYVDAFQTIKSWWSDLVGDWQSGFDKLIGWIQTALNWLRKIGNAAVPGWIQDLTGIHFDSFAATGFTAAAAQAALTTPSVLVKPMAFAAPQILAAPTLADAPANRSATANAGPTANYTFNLTVNGAVDKEATGRQIIDLIDEYLRNNGRIPAAGFSAVIG